MPAVLWWSTRADAVVYVLDRTGFWDPGPVGMKALGCVIACYALVP